MTGRSIDAEPGRMAWCSLGFHPGHHSFIVQDRLVGASNGLTFVVAPTASTALYSVWGPLPVAVAAAIMAVVTIFVAVHRRFRGLSATPVAPAATRPG